MIEAKIATPLLSALGSGLTVERVLTELPMFKPKIESTIGWLKTKARCTDAEFEDRIIGLREIITRKDTAIKNQKWDAAADLRAKQCAIFDSFGIDCRTSKHPGASMFTPTDIYIHHLAELLSEKDESDS